MADSKRLLTLKRLTAHLEAEVSVDRGYKHDLAGKVFRGRSKFNHEEDGGVGVPLVSVLESPDADRFPLRTGYQDGVEAATQRDNWVLLIQGWVENDLENPTDPAYELMADVKKALAKVTQDETLYDRLTGPRHNPDFSPETHMLGGLISGISTEPGTVRPPTEQVSSNAFFWMRVVLQFVEDTNDPYSI